MSRHPDKTRQKAINMVNEGASYLEVSEKLKIPKSTIGSWVDKDTTTKTTKITKSRKKVPAVYDPELKARVIDSVLKGGKTVKEAADENNLKYHSVFVWCNNAKKGVKKESIESNEANIVSENREITKVTKAKRRVAKLGRPGNPIPFMQEHLQHVQGQGERAVENKNHIDTKQFNMLKLQNEYLKKVLALHLDTLGFEL